MKDVTWQLIYKILYEIFETIGSKEKKRENKLKRKRSLTTICYERLKRISYL